MPTGAGAGKVGFANGALGARVWLDARCSQVLVVLDEFILAERGLFVFSRAHARTVLMCKCHVATQAAASFDFGF